MIYKFNHVSIDANNFTLTVKGVESQVEPQVFNLIIYLIQHQDRIVSRNELLENIWDGRAISDASINNHIKSARKALEDDGIKQEVIKTIHSRGYQFIADVKTISESSHTTIVPYKLPLVIGLLLVTTVLLYFSIKYVNHYQLRKSVQNIAYYQETSYLTFVAQAKRRNELVNMIEARIGDNRQMQFEKYFSYYFEKLNNEEMFVFGQIRGMTERGLYQNNLKIIEELNNNPEIISQISGTKELQQHLEFWLNKYHSVFKLRKDMCLLYVGVEDGVPYPSDVNESIVDWLKKN